MLASPARWEKQSSLQSPVRLGTHDSLQSSNIIELDWTLPVQCVFLLEFVLYVVKTVLSHPVTNQ